MTTKQRDVCRECDGTYLDIEFEGYYANDIPNHDLYIQKQ